MTKHLVINLNLRWLYAILVLAAVATASVYVASSKASVPKSPAGFWRGSSKAKRVSDLGVATINVDYNSEFWFVVDEQGSITDGHAVAVYNVWLDDSKLRGLVVLGNSASSFPLTTIPSIGSLLGTGFSLRNFVGVRMSYDETMPIREGKIRGSLRDGILQLEWESPPQELPYKSYKIYATKEEVLQASQAPAYSPWSAPARVSEVAFGQWQAVVDSGQRLKSKDKIVSSTFWTAHRVGDDK